MMMSQSIWWLLAGMAVVAELLTGTVYLLLLAAGLASGALAAMNGWQPTHQLLIASAVAAALIAGWHIWRREHLAPKPANADPDVNMDVGQTVQVTAWQDDASATVRYRGAQWAVQLLPGHPAAAGPHLIKEVVGSKLMVEPEQMPPTGHQDRAH
jgi:membrane protein implicated in regulation of membrane protease activity